MKRHRNDEEFGRSVDSQFCDRLGKHFAQRAGYRMESIVFERMQSTSHPLFVDSVGNGAYKGRRRQTANPAEVGG